MQLKFINQNNFFYIVIFFSFLNFGFPLLINGFDIFTRFHLFDSKMWYFYKFENEFILETYLHFITFVLISFLIFKIFNNLFNKSYIKPNKFKDRNYLEIGEKKVILVNFFLFLSIFFVYIGTFIFDGVILQILFNLKFFLYISILYFIFNFRNYIKYLIFLFLFFFLISFIPIILFNGSIIDLFFISLMYIFLTFIFKKKLKFVLTGLIIIFINTLVMQTFKNEIRSNKFFSTTEVLNYQELINDNLERPGSYIYIKKKDQLTFVPSGVIFNPIIKYNPPDKIIAYIINQINTIYNRFSKTNEFAWIIKLHKGVYLYDDTINNLGETTDDTLLIKKEYKKGETYKNLFTKVLPRFIFPKKGKENLANEFGREYLMLPSTDYKTAVNLHILIESYINFGLKGVIFISIFFGLFIFISYSICIRRKNLFSSLLFAIPIIVFSTSLESNFSSSFGGVIFQYLLILFSIFFVNQLALVSKNFQVVSRKLLS